MRILNLPRLFTSTALLMAAFVQAVEPPEFGLDRVGGQVETNKLKLPAGKWEAMVEAVSQIPAAAQLAVADGPRGDERGTYPQEICDE